MMSLHNNLRVVLVYFILSVVGCFTELLVGDTNGQNDLNREVKRQQLEHIKRVNLPSQIPIRGILQRNLAQLKSPNRINPVPYSQRNDGNAKKTSFSHTEPRRSTDVVYYHAIQSKVNSRNNPLVLTGAKYNDKSDAKNRYAFQRVQQKPNAFIFTGRQKSSSDTNPTPRLIKKEGLANGMHAPNVYTSGPFTYEHLSKSKSEMYPDSSQLLEHNKPYLRENISVLPIIKPGNAERISSDYMSRKSNVYHNVRHKNDGTIQYDNRNVLPIDDQNEKMLRKVIPVSKSLTIVRANKKVDTQPHVSSTGMKAVSQIYNEHVGLSKVFVPQLPAVTVGMPKPTQFTKSHSNRIHSFIPLKKAKKNSFQHDEVGRQDSERIASPNASQQKSLHSKNTKPNVTTYAFKGSQRDSLAASQNGYQNGGRSHDPIVPIQNFHSRREYDSLAADASAIRPSVANIARSYKGFLLAENSRIQNQMSAASSRLKQNTDFNEKAIYSSPRIQLPMTSLALKLPITVSPSLWNSSQHNTGKGPGQSTGQSLFVKNYPVPNPMPGNTMKITHSISQSVSGAQGTYKNSDASSSQNQPYYLTSKKPYAFKGFMIFPTMQTPPQQTEMYSGRKHPPRSKTNAVQYASAHPRTALIVPKEEKHLIHAQNPLISNRYQTTRLQDIKTSHGKQSYKDQIGAVNNGAYHETVSSTEDAGKQQSKTPKHHVVTGQTMKASLGSLSGTSTSINLGPNNRAISIQNNPISGYKAIKEFQFDEGLSETSQRWASRRLVSAQKNQAPDVTHKVLGVQKSSQSETTTARLTNVRFSRPNTYSNLFFKSSNMSSVTANAGNTLTTHDSTVPIDTINANMSARLSSVYHKTDLSQNTDFTRNTQLPTRHRSINGGTVSLTPEKYNRDATNPISDVVPQIHRSTTNKVTKYPYALNAVVQPHHGDVQKKAIDVLLNPTKEIKKDINSGGITQSNINENYNAISLRPTSSVVIGRQVVNQVGRKSENYQNIYVVPTSQSAIYRSAGIDSYKTSNNSAKPVYQPTRHRSVIKPFGKANIFEVNVGTGFPRSETTRISVNRSASKIDFDLSAVGVSQASRPTSSFVLGKYVNVFEEASTKSNLNVSQTKGLHHYKPVQFSDIAGSASFSNIKPSSVAGISKDKVALRSVQNISNSTSGMEKSFAKFPFAIKTNNFTIISEMQKIENGLQSTASLSDSDLMPTAVTTDPQPSFTEENTSPQSTVYSSEPDPGNQTTPTAESIVPFYERILIPDTTISVTMPSD